MRLRFAVGIPRLFPVPIRALDGGAACCFPVGMWSRYLSISPPASKRTVCLSDGEQQFLAQFIDWLAQVTAPVPGCAVTGGLGLAMLVGGFFRSHGDVDIGVEEDSFPDLTRALQNAGYELYVATASVRLLSGRMLTCLRRVSVSAAARRRYRHIRFMRAARAGVWVPHAGMADRLDVYVHRVEGDRMLHLSKKHGVAPPARFAVPAEVQTPSGLPIRVFSADYMYWIKCRKGTPKDYEDMRRLRAHGYLPPPFAQQRLALADAQPSAAAGVFPAEAVQE